MTPSLPTTRWNSARDRACGGARQGARGRGIFSRLEDRFQLLTGGRRTALPRQQTLRAAVDWSYELPVPKEKTLLNRVGVFAGVALEAVEAVCACGRRRKEDMRSICSPTSSTSPL